MSAIFRTRIAPTPSGYLHLGNAFSFVLTALLAQKNNGILRLRIDDLDADRMRIAYLDDIFFSLEWLGIEWQEGASGTDDFLKNFSQQHRLPLYQQYLKRLTEAGVVYACTCSRTQWQSLIINGLYPQMCRDKNLNLQQNNVAWRVAIPENYKVKIKEYSENVQEINLMQTLGDFVVRRKDNGNPAYQIACIADDEADKINFIVRGTDLVQSTAAQIFLSRAAGSGYFNNITFLHHGLIRDEAMQKMSKSHASLSLKQMRESGVKSQEILWFIAQSLGIKNPKTNSLSAILTDWSQVQIPYNDWQFKI